MPIFTRLEDNTVVDTSGRVIFVGPDLLKSIITEKKHCSLCCQKDVKTNLEHVIPNWLLKAATAHQDSITIFGTILHRLSTYRVRLCEKCNDCMADMLETPVSDAFKRGYAGVRELADSSPDVLYSWLSWIYLKTHLKDLSIPIHKDRRKGNAKVGDLYDWKGFHAVLSLARALIFSNIITEKAMGTLLIFRVTDHERFHPFNYADNPDGHLVFIRLKDCVILASLSDGGTIEKMLSDVLSSLPQEITAFQAAELLAEFHFAGSRIQSPTQLDHEFDNETGEVILELKPNQTVTFLPSEKSVRDDTLKYNLLPQFQYIKMQDAVIECIFTNIDSNNFSFIPYLNGLSRSFPKQEFSIK